LTKVARLYVPVLNRSDPILAPLYQENDKMRISKPVLTVGIAAVALASAAWSAPEDQDVFTDFETINTSTGVPFMVGSAEFSGDAFSGVAGIGELYRSGSHAWMVNPEGTGIIDFGDMNAASVEFWARIRSGADGSSTYTSFDEGGSMIQAVTIDTPGAFQLVSFSGDIDHITVVNNATVAGGDRLMNSIDDFGYTTVPEPTSLVLLGLGGLLLTCRRRA